MIRLNDLYLCIQGEGCLAGTPMVLIRLHGCSVGCPFCDTKETWANDEENRVPDLHQAQADPSKWCEMEASDVAIAASEIRQGAKWALITGGEPADQDLHQLVACLNACGFLVAVETSGTATGHMGAGVHWVCVSPKLGMPGAKPVLPDVVNTANEIKMVVGKPEDVTKLEDLLERSSFKGTVCLQPMSTNPEATRFCISTCQRKGWRLSLQTHKWINER